MESKKTKEQKADEIFNKRFTLKRAQDNFPLPNAEEIFSSEPFEFEHLIAARDELNATKSLLNDKDNQKWRNHTNNMNPSGRVVKKVREKANPELCTQAWVKFYEILASTDLVPNACLENKEFSSLHLCEGPGAFVASLNHFIKSKVPTIKWSWLATTLNPFYEGNNIKCMIESERFIFETEKHWYFGRWFDGDLMNKENWFALQQQSSAYLGKANLITADGSIDCAKEPDKQETTIGQLLYCEVVAALTMLAKDGSFVVKMFTMFEHHTIGILYLLCCCFTQIEIIKPGTSKPGNSEVYCVCTGFCGAEVIPSDVMQKLLDSYSSQQPTLSLIPEHSLPSSYLDAIGECAKKFTAYQTETITTNLALFENISKAKRKFLTGLQEHVASEYLGRFGVPVVNQNLCVVTRFHLCGNQISFSPSNYYRLSGSYHQRLDIIDCSWQERVVKSQASFETKEQLMQDVINVVPVVWLSSPSEVQDFHFGSNYNAIHLGRPIQKIQSSRFCSATFIDELNEAKRCATVFHEASAQSWLADFEKAAKEMLGLSATSPPHDILVQHHLLQDRAHTRFLDVSGDGRFARELIECGFFQAENCFALLCACCSAKLPNNGPAFARSVITGSCSGCPSARDCADLRARYGMDTATNLLFGSVFASCNTDTEKSKYDELECRGVFLNQCLLVLSVIKNGEHLVLEICDTLTQFTAGLVHILHLLFEEVALCHVTGNLKCYPRQYLVCRSYMAAANNDDVGNHLFAVAKTMVEHQHVSDVIGLVPIRKLFHKHFYHWLRKHTTEFMKKQLDFIINLEKIWLEESSNENSV